MNITTFLKVGRNLIISPELLWKHLNLIMHKYIIETPPSFWDRYRFLSKEQTLNYLLKNKKSFIRFGDGEFAILYGFDIPFQRYSPLLKNSLERIIRTYTLDSPYLLGLPFRFLKMSYSDLKKIGKLAYWQKGKIFMQSYISERCIYGDSFTFRSTDIPGDSPLKDQEIFELWRNKEVLLVGSMAKNFKNKYLPLAKAQYLLECPTTNAFEKREEIMGSIYEIIDSHRLRRENMIILISLGPAAKVIAYELSKKGLIVYDMGHYFDLRSNFWCV